MILVGSTETFTLNAVLNDAPWNLAGATVTLLLTPPGGADQTYTATITDASGGIATYTVANTVLVTAGDWQKRWHIVQGNLDETTPPEHFTVIAVASVPVCVSSDTAYASVTDLVFAGDIRTCCQLCSDNDTPIGLVNGKVTTTTLATLATNENALYALMVASGIVEAACLVAGIYSAVELAALGSSVGGMLLRRIVAGLALHELYMRRPNPNAKIPESVKEAKEFLEMLSLGNRIFGLQKQVEAGVLTNDAMSPEQFAERGENSVRANRLFGRRSQYLPRPTGTGLDWRNC